MGIIERAGGAGACGVRAMVGEVMGTVVMILVAQF